MEDELRTKTGAVIPRLRFRPEIFLDRTTVLYGGSGSGKSVCIKNIMKTLNGHIDRILVVSPTEPANNTYKGTVDKTLIHYELFLEDLDVKGKNKDDPIKGAIRFLDRIWKLQEMQASIYKRANDPNVLSSLFNKIPDSMQHAAIRVMEEYTRKRDKNISRIQRQYEHEDLKRTELVKGINESYGAAVDRLRKKYILKCAYHLLRLNLTEDQKYAIQYLEFNPRLLLILDDCASGFKQLVKNPTVRKLFYQGRWAFLTLMISCQDDTDLPPNLKKNAFVSIFTEPTVTSSMFNRASISASKEHRSLVNNNVGEIFVNHRKFAYIREDPSKQHFYVINETPAKPFRFGSQALHDLCDMLRCEETRMDEKNPYYKKFKI